MAPKISPYSRMYLVTPSIYEKVLACLDESDRKLTEQMNRPGGDDEPKRPSEVMLENIGAGEVMGEPLPTAPGSSRVQELQSEIIGEVPMETQPTQIFSGKRKRGTSEWKPSKRFMVGSEEMDPSVSGSLETVDQPLPVRHVTRFVEEYIPPPPEAPMNVEEILESQSFRGPVIPPPAPMRRERFSDPFVPPVNVEAPITTERILEGQRFREPIVPPAPAPAIRRARFSEPFTEIAVEDPMTAERILETPQFRNVAIQPQLQPIVPQGRFSTGIVPTFIAPPVSTQQILESVPFRKKVKVPTQIIQHCVSSTGGKICGGPSDVRDPEEHEIGSRGGKTVYSRQSKQCPICGKVVYRQFNLIRHISLMHNLDPDEVLYDYERRQTEQPTSSSSSQFQRWSDVEDVPLSQLRQMIKAKPKETTPEKTLKTTKRFQSWE